MVEHPGISRRVGPRGAGPIGPWSTCTTLSSWPIPVTLRALARHHPRAVQLLSASALNKMSLTSVDLPDPDTPVTAMNTQRERHVHPAQVMLGRALDHVLPAPERGRRAAGSAIDWRPVRYAPVSDPELASSSSTGPDTTMLPPVLPAPGPMSTTQSAARIGVLVMLHHDQRVTEVP